MHSTYFTFGRLPDPPCQPARLRNLTPGKEGRNLPRNLIWILLFKVNRITFHSLLTSSMSPCITTTPSHPPRPENKTKHSKCKATICCFFIQCEGLTYSYSCDITILQSGYVWKRVPRIHLGRLDCNGWKR